MRLLNTGAARFDRWLNTLDAQLRQLPNVTAMVTVLRRLHLVPSTYMISTEWWLGCPPSYRLVFRWHPQNWTTWAFVSLDPGGKLMWCMARQPVAETLDVSAMSAQALELTIEAKLRLVSDSVKGMPERL